jgi:hypothetical protein
MPGSKEERMSADNFQGKTPDYTFLGSSPADEFREVARIHYKEAKQLFDRALQAQAEDRQEEAKLLMDLAISRRARADEFERAARGEGGDPIVSEILDSQEEMKVKFTPYAPTFMSKEELLRTELPADMKPAPLGRIARAVAWIGSWVTR